jgi:preprotein translocase subunit SecA
MFRRFAKEETEKWIKKAKTDENGEILNKDIHEFVDRVQRICEGTNFSIREYNLKLDDVLNDQRTAIYRLRNRILENDRLIPLMIDMLREYVPYEVEQHCPIEMLPEEWNLGELSERLHEIIPFPAVQLSENINDIEDVKSSVQHSLEQYIHYLETMDDAERVLSEIKSSLLSIVDYHWLNHLDAMERLKEGIGLRHYSQEDPIRQYQREGFELFVYTYRQIEADVCRRLAQEVASKIASS